MEYQTPTYLLVFHFLVHITKFDLHHFEVLVRDGGDGLLLGLNFLEQADLELQRHILGLHRIELILLVMQHILKVLILILQVLDDLLHEDLLFLVDVVGLSFGGLGGGDLVLFTLDLLEESNLELVAHDLAFHVSLITLLILEHFLEVLVLVFKIVDHLL